jgi:hypothetical protein
MRVGVRFLCVCLFVCGYISSASLQFGYLYVGPFVWLSLSLSLSLSLVLVQ